MALIRLILTLSITIAHAQSESIFGFKLLEAHLAVEAYYIISGFFITFILNTKYPPTPRMTLIFYINRYLRILPTYWVVLALAILLAYSTQHLNELNVNSFYSYVTHM